MKQILIAIIVCVFIINATAQLRHSGMSRYGFDVNSHPPIYYNAFISYINGPELILSLKIQNDILQFQKNDNLYTSKYEVSINLRNLKDKRTFLSDSWSENVTLSNFTKTNSKQTYQESRRKIRINEDIEKFELYLEVRDGLTGNVFHNTRIIGIKQDNKNSIMHSNIVILETKENIENDIHISAFENLKKFNRQLLTYFEIETPVSDSLSIESKIFRLEDENYTPLDTNIYSIYSQNNFYQFVDEINNSLLEEGKYKLDYKINYNQNTVTISDTIDVVWFNKPVYLYKYDLALRPMKYLLAEDEFEKANDLSDSELKEWFVSYWKEKDPTPDTPINEIQFEFYSRVHKAIKEFSLRFKEGWKTDRGEALILYGEPSSVESHHHVVDRKPFEIWHYKENNKKLIFVDTNKNGDFKLRSIEKIEETN